MATEVYVDRERGAVVVNQSGHDLPELMPSLRRHPEIAALVNWTSNTLPRSASGHVRHGSLLERDRFVTPENPYDQMRVAYDAAGADDVVSKSLSSMESLAFGRMTVECTDPDDEDIWNQWREDVDLDSRMRELWREESITSNAYATLWWDRRSYKVRGKSKAADGISRQRKKVYNDLRVPVGISVLDPLRILPVGGFLFGQERLCYIADWTEKDAIDSYLLGGDTSGVDPIVAQLIIEKYVPDLRDRKQIGNLGVDPNRLFLMDPTKVFRMTPTRSAYERFATVRLKSIFEILDLKHQMRQMDRAHLIGATNFIVLIKKGSKDRPAQQEEIDALTTGVKSLAQVPVLIGDDRLSVEIITPKTDTTLNPEKALGLDMGIQANLLGMFITTRSRGDDSIKLARVVARGLEDKRDQHVRQLMRMVLLPMYRANDALTAEPELRFYPKRIALDFDPALATYLLDLRDRGDLSRDSILSEIDYDEEDEARKREYEAENYDHIFQTQVPFSSAGAGPAAGNPRSPALGPGPGQPALGPGAPGPKPAGSPSTGSPGQRAPQAGGRNRGGNRNGGGAAPGTGQGQPPRRPAPARAALDVDISQVSHRTRAHAAAAAALARRRRDQQDATDAALEEQRAALIARFQAGVDAIHDEHAAELAQLGMTVDDLQDRLAVYEPDMPTGEET